MRFGFARHHRRALKSDFTQENQSNFPIQLIAHVSETKRTIWSIWGRAARVRHLRTQNRPVLLQFPSANRHQTNNEVILLLLRENDLRQRKRT